MIERSITRYSTFERVFLIVLVVVLVLLSSFDPAIGDENWVWAFQLALVAALIAISVRAGLRTRRASRPALHDASAMHEKV